MPSGGKRVRSGPAKDPNSEKSRRLGYTLQSLPNTECPGSILQMHPDCILVADEEALSLL